MERWWPQKVWWHTALVSNNLVLGLPITHRIHVYIYHKNQPNVGKYTSPMDPMGIIIVPPCSAMRTQYCLLFLGDGNNAALRLQGDRGKFLGIFLGEIRGFFSTEIRGVLLKKYENVGEVDFFLKLDRCWTWYFRPFLLILIVLILAIICVRFFCQIDRSPEIHASQMCLKTPRSVKNVFIEMCFEIACVPVKLLMEEILHHLAGMKPSK